MAARRSILNDRSGTVDVPVNWIRLGIEPDGVEAFGGEALCPFCNERNWIVSNATEVMERDVCEHFDGETATGFAFTNAD